MTWEQPSLCIPRLQNGNIDSSNIRKVFEQLKFGKIQRIDIIERKNDKGEPFKRAFIHFEKWNNNEYVETRINVLQNIKILILLFFVFVFIKKLNYFFIN